MKAKLLIFLIGICFISCNDVDDVPPPAAANIDKEFVKPAGVPMTQEDRDIINAIRAEYELATK